MPKISPFSTEKSIESMAARDPKYFVKCFPSSIAIAAKSLLASFVKREELPLFRKEGRGEIL
jgi:hypothetical protein